MSVANLLSRPWLPRPTDADRILLRGDPDPEALRTLARLGWDEPDLVRIAKRLPETGARVLVVSSARAAPLAAPLRTIAWGQGLGLAVTCAEHEEPAAALARLQGGGERFGVCVLWLDEGDLVVPGPLGDPAAEETALAAAGSRLQDLLASAGRVADTVIVATLPQRLDAPRHPGERRLPGSPRRLLRRLNDVIAESGAGVWDLEGLAEEVGLAAWDPGRARHLATDRVHPRLLPLLADRLVTVIGALLGRQRKVLVLDLDDTLWGGTVGDDGLAGLGLAPGTPAGDAHRALQAFARRWRERGILLAILSRNDPALARTALASAPGMVLTPDDFSDIDLGWDPKSQRLVAIAKRLGVGPEALVVVDDDPVQRAEMRALVPDAFVPELPRDVADWPALLEATGAFASGPLTAEDTARAADLAANRIRKEGLSGDRQSFLRSLDMVLSVAPAAEADLPRVAQLVARTNQFNLTGIRRDEPALRALMASTDWIVLAASLSDRLSHSGLISVLICHVTGRDWEIDTWVMSCRVLGRQVEDAVMGALAAWARAAGAERLIGTYVPSARNGIVADLFPRLGFASIPGEANRFVASLADWRAPDTLIRVDQTDQISPGPGGASGAAP